MFRRAASLCRNESRQILLATFSDEKLAGQWEELVASAWTEEAASEVAQRLK
jgi:hypothetical protein